MEFKIPYLKDSVMVLYVHIDSDFMDFQMTVTLTCIGTFMYAI